MAANTLPSGIGDLFQLADCMLDGLTIHGPWVLRGSVKADELSGPLRDAREAEAALARANVVKSEAAKTFATADANLTSWLAKARLVVMLAYGSKWSGSWLAAGFTHRGTNVPKRIGPRMELSRRLADFFTEHREYEVEFAHVTAERAHTLQKEIAIAQRDVQITDSDAGAKKHVRDAAEKRLRAQVRKVRILLSVSLGKSDPRWLAFGLNRPGNDIHPAREIRNAVGSEPLKIEFGARDKTAVDDIAVA